MKTHKKIFLTLTASLLFTVNYGNSSLVSAITAPQEAQESWKNIYEGAKLQLQNMSEDDIQKRISDIHQITTLISDANMDKIQATANDVYEVLRDPNMAQLSGINIGKLESHGVTPALITSKIKMFKDGILKIGETEHQEIDKLKESWELINTIMNSFTENQQQGIVELVNNFTGDNIQNLQKRMKRLSLDECEKIMAKLIKFARNVADIFPQDKQQEIKEFIRSTNNLSPDQKQQILNVFSSIDSNATAADMLKAVAQAVRKEAEDNITELTKEKEKITQETNESKSKIEKLKTKDPEKSDPNTQAEIKQEEEKLKKKEEVSKKIDEKLKTNQEIIDQQNRPEVIKVQEKLQIAQAAIEAQTYAVRNIAAIQSSIVSNIINTRMNADQYAIRTPENENKTVAAGSQIADAYITPASWDIWASGHMGNIKQGADNATSPNSKTGFYGGSIGIDKIFANNSILGLALSYGQSTTEYKSKAANEKWESQYYQADAYIHHNFTDNLFIQLIGGIGTYGKDTTIGNIFDFSSQKSTFGYHGNATIGYSIFSGEDSNFAITPQLGVAYYHLSIPDSILSKTDSSTFTTLGRFDGIAGLNIKMLNLNSNSNSNVKITPEITAAFKYRFSDNVDGINSDNIKLPVAKSKSTNSNDLSANALATPEQLFTLGLALTVATNNNFSISLNISSDFATQYFAIVGGASLKLSF